MSCRLAPASCCFTASQSALSASTLFRSSTAASLSKKLLAFLPKRALMAVAICSGSRRLRATCITGKEIPLKSIVAGAASALGFRCCGLFGQGEGDLWSGFSHLRINGLLKTGWNPHGFRDCGQSSNRRHRTKWAIARRWGLYLPGNAAKNPADSQKRSRKTGCRHFCGFPFTLGKPPSGMPT